MTHPLRPTGLALVACACGGSPPLEQPAPPPRPPVIQPVVNEAPQAASGSGLTAGPFSFTPVLHATTLIEVDGLRVWLDPWSKADLSAAAPADVVLITDIHGDHLDEDGLAAVVGADTVIVGPQAVKDARDGKVDVVVANGQTVEVKGLTITGVAMYNLTRGPEPGRLFHDKGRGSGYLIEKSGTRVYLAGDTACTDEMKALTNIDLAFLPMNLPYTMTPEEAAECVAAFKPAVAVPYHYRDSDPGVFAAALADVEGVTVTQVAFYGEDAPPGGDPPPGQGE